MNTEQTDEQLAQAAKADHAAFEDLYHRYVTPVYRYCYARTNNVVDAEDLTMQTFLAALESIARYRGQGAFAAWLFSIARRKCADHHRARYAHPKVNLDAADQQPDLDAPDPEERASCADVLDCVRQMLPQLSPDRCEAIQLRYWGGLPIRAIAKAMRRSEGAVKMLISRALNDLRERCLDESQLARP
ncbi:MAG TPA: RNA polymerase sigma factor [Chloroflexi bacterium]|nr:RNA polymerase sigma factor [Chloroflexota bacterium]